MLINNKIKQYLGENRSKHAKKEIAKLTNRKLRNYEEIFLEERPKFKKNKKKKKKEMLFNLKKGDVVKVRYSDVLKIKVDGKRIDRGGGGFWDREYEGIGADKPIPCLTILLEIRITKLRKTKTKNKYKGEGVIVGFGGYYEYEKLCQKLNTEMLEYFDKYLKGKEVLFEFSKQTMKYNLNG